MNTTPAQILQLHKSYESLTGHVTRLDTGREHLWFDWLKFSAERTWTEGDLAIVIGWIIKEYKAGRRQGLSGLRFDILIGQPHEFEQLLNQIHAEQRARTRPNPIHQLRPAEPAVIQQTSHSRHVSKIVKAGSVMSLIEQMRKAVE